jgi:hypothetical protein
VESPVALQGEVHNVPVRGVAVYAQLPNHTYIHTYICFHIPG